MYLGAFLNGTRCVRGTVGMAGKWNARYFHDTVCFWPIVTATIRKFGILSLHWRWEFLILGCLTKWHTCNYVKTNFKNTFGILAVCASCVRNLGL